MSVWRRVKERVGLTPQADDQARLSEEMHNEQAYGTNTSNRSSNDYTELRAGSVLCPSCKGTGWIPRELEETLIALIPVNDDRLKPRRTIFWVLLGIAIVLVFAAIAIFMLIPRAVELTPNRGAIDKINVKKNSESLDSIQFSFLNFVNVENHNYYSVKVVNTSASITNKFQPWNSDIIGAGQNRSIVSVAPLSLINNRLYFNNTVTLTGYTAEYCQATFSKLTSLYVNMQFDITAMLEYFHHKETITLSTVQQVCCVTSGNCTSPG